MVKVVIAVVAGYAAWTVLWLGGNAALFAEAAEVVGAGEAYTEAGPLVGALVLSVVCSVVAGLLCAKLAGERAKGALTTLAALLLATGLGVQGGVWDLMPVWYHVTFLALLVPVVVVCGRAAASPTTGRVATA